MTNLCTFIVKVYLGNMPSSSSIFLFWVVFMAIMLMSKALDQIEMWVLAVWTSQYERHDPSEVSTGL